ncbi:hypothetical protein [Candidatus Arcticimaribacter forsetii]|uniref:capsular polysaccharide export protein, LipB/KpsS family n=1 Tax=Candidatus Arcticimaribacter forsetii TaxID=2820661 RepID=UPI00207708D3|nr:hypothetical protein [Candidatus Arcticimaribacter forsetii]MDB2329281.1 hypothetical protein [Flavobacteriaceae bacterium]MDB4674046.1 hypothetical protein [Flavobacteriaceae bacterium]
MSNSKNTVCFFSFGYSHPFYERLIQNQEFNDLLESPNFIFIAPNRTHQSFFDKNKFETFYLSDSITKLKNKFTKSNNLSIGTQKKSIINLPAWKQESIYFQMNQFIHSTLSSKKVTHLILSQPIEGLAGILLAENARKLNIKRFVPHSCRFLNHSFFSENQYEEITFYKKEASTKSKLKANQIIEDIRISKKVQKYPYKSLIKQPLIIRVFAYVKRIILFEKIDIPRLKVSLENNLSFLYKFKYFIKRLRSKKYFDIKSMDQLPDKFIFFPLQYTPESSINIPNPFFVDQKRLIDLVRFNMPDDYLLLLKENPSMFGRREPNFYKQTSRKSGVRLVNSNLNTFDLMSKADLVVSVSGTACLEAFIIRKPSIVFGKTFFDPFINLFDVDFNNLKQTIDKYLNRKIDDKEIEEAVALILENSAKFKCGAVDTDAQLISDKNVNAFVDGMKNQIINYRI